MKWAYSEPATAEKNAPTTNASSRGSMTRIPIACAATRSSRWANMSRPYEERLIRHTT